jgi:branched-chain amino acid transport system ATP-binding protein
VLNVRGLSVRYGRSVRALEEVDVEVAGDAVLAVLGGNGAGKSTLLRAVSGTLPLHRGAVTAGEILLDGERIDRLDPALVVRRGVVAVPEGRQVFARMTVEENLRAGGLGARSAAARSEARERVHGLFPVLAERSRQRAGLLSGGEQMLAIGRALMSSPSLLLLDEPSLGLAPQMVGRIAAVVREIHDQGTAVVLVEQNATMALQVADHAAVLEVGRIALSGPAAELAASEDVQRLYLGGHAESDAQAAAESRDAARASAGRHLARWTR